MVRVLLGSSGVMATKYYALGLESVQVLLQAENCNIAEEAPFPTIKCDHKGLFLKSSVLLCFFPTESSRLNSGSLSPTLIALVRSNVFGRSSLAAIIGAFITSGAFFFKLKAIRLILVLICG